MNKEQIFGNGGDGVSAVSFEELESAFGTPTQCADYYERRSEPSGVSMPRSLVDPDGSAAGPIPMEEAAEVSPEKASRTGERIARLADAGIDFALSNFVAHNNETYRADERDLQDIAECWGELAGERGWSIGPEWSLVILYAMVYGPLLKQAVADRRMDEMEKRQAAMDRRIDAMERQREESHGDEGED